jgi:hypothetical protein
MQYEISKALGVRVDDSMDFLEFSFYYNQVLMGTKQKSNQSNELGRIMGI